eukprot:gb/GFBE01035976.1/.p1 GENE.gb/GFBE01035976.1/~~gb/GFBE01035976.1/.p1  ORF type:complete len:418 (+),score=63.08 gb/GFBE01035976.1/:1-1254(+)
MDDASLEITSMLPAESCHERCDAASASTAASEHDRPVALSRLPLLRAPSPLEGLKSRKRPVLSLGLELQFPKPNAEGTASSSSRAFAVEVALVSRVSLQGLSACESRSLLEDLATAAEPAGGQGHGWQLWQHRGLHVATIAACADESRMAQSLEAQLAVLAAEPCHVICVELDALKGNPGTCALLRSFKGGLLILESPASQSEDDEAATLLRALGVTARFRRDCDAAGGFAPADLPEVSVGEVIGDLRLKDLASAELEHLIEAAELLYDEHFHAPLREDLEGWSESRLGLLVTTPKDQVARELLGFIVYKFWGPPLRVMSILRVAVPQRCRMQGLGRQLVRWAMEKARQKPRSDCTRVTLCAMPSAIPFYERLQFTPIPLEDLQPLPEGDDEGGAEMPGATWMEHRCGRSYKANSRR